MKQIKYSKKSSIRATKTTIKMLLMINSISFIAVPFIGTNFLKLIVIFNVFLLGIDYLYDLLRGKGGKVSK